MGVKDLWSLLAPVKQHRDLGELRGKTIAVDLSMWVCESLGVKQMQGSVTRPYLRNLFFRISNLLQLQVTLVFVVDGTPPELKLETMMKRQQARLGPGAAKPVKVGKPGRSHFQAWLRECCRMLETLGVPYVESAGEAEAMCALLDKEGVVDGCLTDDGDAFLYGARTIYRNFTLDRKDPHVEVYRMSDIETTLKLSREKLVAMATLLGCDYVPRGVPGVGRETVVKLMANWNTTNVIERLRRWKSDVSFDHLERQCASKKPTHCGTCKHPGSATLHRQSGCDLCGTRESCVGGATEDQCLCSWHQLQTQLSGFAAELSVRRKALNTPGFPHEKVFQEFLVSKDKLPKRKLDWKQPRLWDFQAFMCERAEWVSEYGIEKILPVLTLWTMTRIRAGCDPAAPGLLCPHSIVKSRTRQGIPSYEVSWQKLAEDQTTESDHYVTVEKQSLFQKCFPLMSALYESSGDAKKKTKPKAKPKKPSEDMNVPSSHDVLSETEELLSRLSIGREARVDNAPSRSELEEHQGFSSSQPVYSMDRICDDDKTHGSSSDHQSPSSPPRSCMQPQSVYHPEVRPMSLSQTTMRQRCSEPSAGENIGLTRHKPKPDPSHGAPSGSQGYYDTLFQQLTHGGPVPRSDGDHGDIPSPGEKVLSLRDRLQLRMRARLQSTAATPKETKDTPTSCIGGQTGNRLVSTSQGPSSGVMDKTDHDSEDSKENLHDPSEHHIQDCDENKWQTPPSELPRTREDMLSTMDKSITLTRHESDTNRLGKPGNDTMDIRPTNLSKAMNVSSAVDLNSHDVTDIIDLCFADGDETINLLPPTWGKTAKKKSKVKSKVKPGMKSGKKESAKEGRCQVLKNKELAVNPRNNQDVCCAKNMVRTKASVDQNKTVQSRMGKDKENEAPCLSQSCEQSAVKTCEADVSVLLGWDETIVSGCLEDVTLRTVRSVSRQKNSIGKIGKSKESKRSPSHQSSSGFAESSAYSVNDFDKVVTDFVDLTLSSSLGCTRESETVMTDNREGSSHKCVDRDVEGTIVEERAAGASRSAGSTMDYICVDTPPDSPAPCMTPRDEAGVSHDMKKSMFVTPSMVDSPTVDLPGGKHDGTTLCVADADKALMKRLNVCLGSSTVYLSPDVSLTLPLDDTVVRQDLLEATTAAATADSTCDVTADSTCDVTADISDTVLLEDTVRTDSLWYTSDRTVSKLHSHGDDGDDVGDNLDVGALAAVPVSDSQLTPSSVHNETGVPSNHASSQDDTQPHHSMYEHEQSAYESCTQSSDGLVSHSGHEGSWDKSVNSDTSPSTHGSLLGDSRDRSTSECSLVPPSPDMGTQPAMCPWNRSQVGTFSMEFTLLNSTAGSCHDISGALGLDN